MSQQTLDELPRGVLGRIRSIAGDDSLSLRLMEMGLLEGESIRLVGAAPLGDPLDFELQGYRISLRRTEARRVLVVPADAADAAT